MKVKNLVKLYRNTGNGVVVQRGSELVDSASEFPFEDNFEFDLSAGEENTLELTVNTFAIENNCLVIYVK